MKIKKLSEFSLIDRISHRFNKYGKDIVKGIGDDAAVIKFNKNTHLLYTCDALVSGVHFNPEYSTPYEIGRKAAAINISDIASMGGKPKYLLVSLFLPKNTTEKFIDELYKGLNKECDLYDINIIGGNISRNNRFIIDLFLVGEVSSDRVLFRSGAQVGDMVLVTGTLGDSAAGLKLLKNRQLNISQLEKKRLVSRHLTPSPRIREGAVISQLKKANSMIDISDGLSNDLSHICDESKVGTRLFIDRIPVSDAAKKVAKLTGRSFIDLAINGGEDYELCFTVPKRYADNISRHIEKETSVKVTIIGEIIPKLQGRWLINNQGEKFPLTPKGWDHLL